ncbi:DUF4102 domain-containing protein [Duganella sp. FT92W]|uniref:DUF4102 domain-containing protein n=1 Tax=Pseudoduganella rivuli TaxID=2666085 RepID=A0A7X2IIH1_9BURK|nr:integrase arm-type DNA-binding domain-containing protein [Pseudoduganella rivuli]MRV70494.1 DUF4102 domain-containing protein [Pseudoduganella rivuli]
MGRQALTVLGVNAKKAPGYYGDGGGLYLQVSPTGSKSWIFRYMLLGRAREMGLGSVADKPLTQARDEASKCRQLVCDGIDPITQRDSLREAAVTAIQNTRTFRECAVEYHRTHSSAWRNPKHTKQWINSLSRFAFPLISDKDVNQIGKAEILAVLEPTWVTLHETASRVRQRIKAILDWAAARDFRTRQDPHLWDQLARALPHRPDLRKPHHFAACPYEQVASVIRAIHECGAAVCIKHAMEAAYFRSDLFDKRRDLMDAWAAYCEARSESSV